MDNLMRFGIFDFLQRETHGLDRKMIVLTVTSGIANAMNLAVINAAVDALRGAGPSWQHFVWFGLSIALFVYSLRYILYESTRIAEAAISSVRLRLADKVRRCDLQAVESIGEGDIHSRISRDTLAIAQAARPLFAAAQGAVMILCTMVYIALVSPVAVLLCVVLIAGGAAKYFRDRAAYDSGLQDASHQEDRLFESLNGLLKGFKEIRINKLKSDDVFEEFQSITTHHLCRDVLRRPAGSCGLRSSGSGNVVHGIGHQDRRRHPVLFRTAEQCGLDDPRACPGECDSGQSPASGKHSGRDAGEIRRARRDSPDRLELVPGDPARRSQLLLSGSRRQANVPVWPDRRRGAAR
jgi:ABC-type multidrug transport system fused ATPase/permease subunit